MTLQSDGVEMCPSDLGISVSTINPTAPTMLANVGFRMDSHCRYFNSWERSREKEKAKDLETIRLRLGTDNVNSAKPPTTPTARVWMRGTVEEPDDVVRGTLMTLDCALNTMVMGTMTAMWHLNRNFPEKYHGSLLEGPTISSLTEYNELSLLNKLTCEWNLGAHNMEDGLNKRSVGGKKILSLAIKKLQNSISIDPFDENLEREWITFQHNYASVVKDDMYRRFRLDQDLLLEKMLEFCKLIFCHLDMNIKFDIFKGMPALYATYFEVSHNDARLLDLVRERIPTMFLHWMMEVPYNGNDVVLNDGGKIPSTKIGQPMPDFHIQETKSGEGARHLSSLMYSIQEGFYNRGRTNFFGYEFGANRPDGFKGLKDADDLSEFVLEDIRLKVIKAFGRSGKTQEEVRKKEYFASAKMKEIVTKQFDINNRIICGDNYVQSFLDYVRYTWKCLRFGFRGTGGFRNLERAKNHEEVVQKVNSDGGEGIPDDLINPPFDCKVAIKGVEQMAAILPYIHYNFAHFYAYNLEMEKIVAKKLKDGRVVGGRAGDYATPLTMLENILPNIVPMRSTSYDLSFRQGEEYSIKQGDKRVENKKRTDPAFYTCCLDPNIFDGGISQEDRKALAHILVNEQLDSIPFLKNLMGVKLYLAKHDVDANPNFKEQPYKSSLFSVNLQVSEQYWGEATVTNAYWYDDKEDKKKSEWRYYTQSVSFKEKVLKGDINDYPQNYPTLEELHDNPNRSWEYEQEKNRILDNWERDPLFFFSHKIPRPGATDNTIPYLAVYEKRNIEALLKKCYFLGDMFQLMVSTNVAMYTLENITFLNRETNERCIYAPVAFSMNNTSVREGFGQSQESGHFWSECKLPAYFGSAFNPVLDDKGKQVQDVRAFSAYSSYSDMEKKTLFTQDGCIWHHCDNMGEKGAKDWDLLVDEEGYLATPYGGPRNPPPRQDAPSLYPSNYRPVGSDRLAMRMIKENMVGVGSLMNHQSSVDRGEDFRPYRVKTFEDGCRFLIFKPDEIVNIDSVVYVKVSAQKLDKM